MLRQHFEEIYKCLENQDTLDLLFKQKLTDKVKISWKANRVEPNVWHRGISSCCSLLLVTDQTRFLAETNCNRIFGSCLLCSSFRQNWNQSFSSLDKILKFSLGTYSLEASVFPCFITGNSIRFNKIGKRRIIQIIIIPNTKFFFGSGFGKL